MTSPAPSLERPADSVTLFDIREDPYLVCACPACGHRAEKFLGRWRGVSLTADSGVRDVERHLHCTACGARGGIILARPVVPRPPRDFRLPI